MITVLVVAQNSVHELIVIPDTMMYLYTHTASLHHDMALDGELLSPAVSPLRREFEV
jgi:hypothetical protein